MGKEKNIDRQPKEVGPQYIGFEGVSIQWNKVPWNFQHPEKGPVSIDTYSIWNPNNWGEIATRLKRGERCAMYIMGNFGVAEVREAPEWQKEEIDDDIFNTIKQRPKMQNLVAFVHPEDARNFIDVGRLHKNHKNFRWADKRLSAYAGPQHNIFPLRTNRMVDEGLLREEDESVACFWIPGHFGYEGIYDRVRKIVKHGIFGGGSLNIHGQEPSYTTEHLHSEIERLPEWQKGIDFVIFDEIAESHGIGRSQSFVSFTGETPELVRIGSLSPEYISRKIGMGVVYDPDKVRKASSLTPYDDANNRITEQKVEETFAQIRRYKKWYKKNRRNLV